MCFGRAGCGEVEQAANGASDLSWPTSFPARSAASLVFHCSGYCDKGCELARRRFVGHAPALRLVWSIAGDAVRA